MSKKKDVKVFKTADGGLFILQRPAVLEKKKRAIAERLEEQRDETKRREAALEALAAGR